MYRIFVHFRGVRLMLSWLQEIILLPAETLLDHCWTLLSCSHTEKKVEPKQLPCGAILEFGASLEGGAIFFLNNHV